MVRGSPHCGASAEARAAPAAEVCGVAAANQPTSGVAAASGPLLTGNGTTATRCASHRRPPRRCGRSGYSWRAPLSPRKKRLLSSVEIVATVASGLPDQEQCSAGAASFVYGGATGVAAPLEPRVGRSDALLVAAAPQVARFHTRTQQAAGTPVVPFKGDDRPAISTALQQHQQRDEACIPLGPASFSPIVDNSVIDAGRRRRETASTKTVAFPIVSLRSSSPPPKMRAYSSVRYSWRRAHAPPRYESRRTWVGRRTGGFLGRRRRRSGTRPSLTRRTATPPGPVSIWAPPAFSLSLQAALAGARVWRQPPSLRNLGPAQRFSTSSVGFCSLRGRLC